MREKESVCVCVFFLEGYNRMRNKKLGSKLIDLGGGGEKIGPIMGNSKVYCGGHKTTAIDQNKRK